MRIRGRRQHIARLPATLTFIAAGIAVLAYLAKFLTGDSATSAAKITIAVGIFGSVITSFWAWFTARQNRIKLTLDLYFNRFANSTYNLHANNFFDHRVIIESALSLKTLRQVDINGGEVGNLVRSVVYILNYWETLATVYVESHIDRQIFDNLSSELVCSTVERTARIIGSLRADDDEVFVNLLSVFWLTASQSHRQALIPLLGKSPNRLSVYDRYQWDRIAAVAVTVIPDSDQGRRTNVSDLPITR